MKKTKKTAKTAKAAAKAAKPRRLAATKAVNRGGASGKAALETVVELALTRDLGRFADALLEESARLRHSLAATLSRFAPEILEKLGATAATLKTRNEQLEEETFDFGAWSAGERAALARALPGGAKLTADGKHTIVAQTLDVAGESVGTAGFSFTGDRLADASVLAGRIDVVCEELDGVLAAIHLAALKQDLIIRVGQALRNLVFDRGVDDALAVLRDSIPLDGFVLLYQDDAAVSADQTIRYRVYRDGVCTNDSEGHPHPRLTALIRSRGHEILDSDSSTVGEALGLKGAIESVLISGITTARVLGKIWVTAKTGLSTFGMDLLRVFAESVSQRLVDYNRERRHLSQFFAPPVINELLRDPAYSERYLAARTDEVALIYADINSFTKISEQVLLDPAKIGRFVDKWSAGAVEILWKHGGVFDKMVGDCVIGIFGPPFFRMDRKTRIAAAVRAAREILAFTISLESDPDLSTIVKSGVVPGLGVAVGLNLCQASVGLFGPNQDFTAFSSGMNATARLQSLAGFREILVMDTARDALGHDSAGLIDAAFEGPVESPVKNVAKPLRFYRVRFPETKQKV